MNLLSVKSDYVSRHAVLDAGTQYRLDAEVITRMKPGACLINTARGELLEETALLSALNSGHLAGAALDVLAAEPPHLHHPRAIVTPHSA